MYYPAAHLGSRKAKLAPDADLALGKCPRKTIVQQRADNVPAVRQVEVRLLRYGFIALVHDRPRTMDGRDAKDHRQTR